MPFFMHHHRPHSQFLTPVFFFFPGLLSLSPEFVPSPTTARQLLTTKPPFLSLEQKKNLYRGFSLDLEATQRG